MLSASLKSLWARKLRLLMSMLAIVLGVAFVAGSFMFTDTLNNAFNGIMNGTVGDVIMRPSTSSGAGSSGGGFGASSAKTLPALILAQVAHSPGVAQADGVVTSMSAYVIDKNNKVVGGQGAPAFGVNYHDAKAAGGVPGLHITQGRAPTKWGEIALDPSTAGHAGFKIGDKVSILTDGQTPRYTATLVGLASYANGSMVGSTLAVVDTASAQRLFLDGKNAYTSIWVSAKPGESQSQLASELSHFAPRGFEVVTGHDAAKQAQNGIKKALTFITTFLLVFAGVALLVGSFLIVNTFSILVAQRSRELALMRALGASGRQVLSSVLIEALVIAVIGSSVGIGLGILLAEGISALIDSLGARLDTGALVLAPRTFVVSFAVGIVVTGFAAWVPARRASRIAPIAAMRDDQVEPEQSVIRRALIGAFMVVLGAGLGVAQLVSHSSIWVFVLGMLLMLFGVIAATPVLAKPVIRAVRALARPRHGVVAVLASENAMRNPRRTSATASALMVGLTLVSMMTVFGASATGSVDSLIKKNFRGDFIVTANFNGPFSDDLAQSMARVEGVQSISRFREVSGTVNQSMSTTIEGVDAATYERVAPLSMKSGRSSLNNNETLASTKTAQFYHLQVGSRVTLSDDARSPRSLVLVGTYDAQNSGTDADFIVTNPTLAAMGAQSKDRTVYILKKPGADSNAVNQRLNQVVADFPTVTVKNEGQYAADQRAPIDRLLILIYGLLGLAIVIAILGIINTLALSVIERTREVGLLRAVGLGRAQLRSMIRLEAVTISLVGATIGVILGVVFGIGFQRTQADSGVNVLVIPVWRLLLFLVLAALVGVLAAWWPARKAARLDILGAISTE